MKEKSRWFSSLRDLTRKLKVLSCKNKNTKVPFDYTLYDYSVLKSFIQQIMKMDHIKLSEEALAYKKCIEDMNEVRSTIQSTCKYMPCVFI